MGKQEARQLDFRPSPIAGTWYSSDPVQLRDEINGYLSRAVLPELEGQVMGVIAPHAGYLYSGPTAGHAFRSVQGRDIGLVVALSPFHDYSGSAFLASSHTAYRTPLGAVMIDREGLESIDLALEEASGEGVTFISADREHSLEIELPFLQCALKEEFQLLPVMVRTRQPEYLEQFARALAEYIQSWKEQNDRDILLVASTDLSHFFPVPKAHELDRYMLDQFEQFSPEGVLRAEQTRKGFACGASAVSAVLWTAKQLGAEQVRILHYSTSADQTGDLHSVVGYGAAAIIKPL
jgi:AmmeMemoRadiSam system protein B